MLKLCVFVKARLLYYKANLILSLSTCQRTRQNVFEYLLSNNLKIRKESPNSSLEEKPRMIPQPPPPPFLLDLNSCYINQDIIIMFTYLYIVLFQIQNVFILLSNNLKIRKSISQY